MERGTGDITVSHETTGHVTDIAKTLGVNATAFGIVTFSDIENLLKILVLVASLTYTCVKIGQALGKGKR
jgi:hypothetical protein